MYKLFMCFQKYKNYKKTNLKKKMKPVIIQYYLRKLYAGKIKGVTDFMKLIEDRYYTIFKIILDINYFYKFMDLIISSINN